MKKFVLIICGMLVCVLIALIVCLSSYKNSIGPVSNSDEKIVFIIEQGDTYYSISEKLEKAGLIKSSDAYKIYLKLNKPKGNLKVGEYYLSPNMGIDKILDEFSNGKAVSHDIQIAFIEGKNMRSIAKTIDKNTENTEEDVYKLLKNKEYLKELINTYWFIDESILNDKIYYSLEGYLYPNKYNFKDTKVTVKEIFKVMLDETEKKLEPYKEAIQKNKYNYHQLATLASIVELEAYSKDRPMVASVFYNRLAIKMPLGSDVTTYYASKVDMGERDLYVTELQEANAYNTRSNTMGGILPVGPICSPTISSIEAVLKPAKSNYLYFVADKNGKVYYTKTYDEHNQIIGKLKNQGLWYEY